MRRPLLFLALMLAVFCASALQAAELGVLTPVLVDGHAQQRAAPDGKMVPVVTRVTSGPLYARLQNEAKHGVTALMLALDEQAQRVAGETTIRPTWLYLSHEDGGFARRGFWLQSGARLRYVPDLFVDLVVDAPSIDDGSFEEIFAHEIGHVLLRRVLPRLPQGYSRTPHAALAVTDRPTAFDEGFAIHFQGLVRQLTHNPRLQQLDHGLQGKPFLDYWASNIDRNARIEGMRRNLFVQAQDVMPGEGNPLGRRDHSTLFDSARLKSGDQMMASEGVVATVFYRWLVPGPEDTPHVLARYRRVLDALAMLDRTRLDPDTPVLVELLRDYRRAYPQQGARAIRIFLETTYGATVDPAMARATEALAARGRVGDMVRYVTALKAARAQLATLIAAVTRQPQRLGAALSSPIWLAGPQPSPSATGGNHLLVVNLNTAEPESLQALNGLDAAMAARIVQERRRNGAYASLGALAQRLRLDGTTQTRLAELNQAARLAGTYHRR